MDLESHRRWYDFSRARDDMLMATDTPHAPWYIVNSNDKRRARLNCITHLLSLVPQSQGQARQDCPSQATEAKGICGAPRPPQGGA